MQRKVIAKFIELITVGLTISCSPKVASTSSKGERVGETVEVNNKNIDWEAFDQLSSIAKSDIRSENLQGLWNAHKGVYRFGEHINAMELTEPMIMEVKEDTYRRNSKGLFEKFTIKNNLIVKATESKIDTGIVNKITATELTISWKDKSNYTRYYYKKH
ncbi:MAG: hypothetical protein ACRYFR_18775 [Janthinobacterium lividum]